MKRIISLLLTLAMVLTMVPGVVFADGEKVAKIGTKEYQTLAEAVTAANDGETIEVYPGNYGALTLNKAVSLKGVGEGEVVFDSIIYTATTDGEGATLTVENVTLNGKIQYMGDQQEVIQAGVADDSKCFRNYKLYVKNCVFTDSINNLCIQVNSWAKDCELYVQDVKFTKAKACISLRDDGLQSDSTFRAQYLMKNKLCEFHATEDSSFAYAIEAYFKSYANGWNNNSTGWIMGYYSAADLNNYYSDRSANDFGVSEITADTQVCNLQSYAHATSTENVNEWPAAAKINKTFYGTLADAVAALNNIEGDESVTLEIFKGTVSPTDDEQLYITRDNVVIKGAGSDKTTIDCQGYTVSGQAGLLVQSNNVTVQDLKVQSTSTNGDVAAIKVSAIGDGQSLPLLDDVQLTNVIASANAGHGINVHGATNTVIENVTSSSTGKCGLSLANAEVTLSGSTLTGNWGSIGMMYKDDVAYTNPVVLRLGDGNIINYISSERPKDNLKGRDRIYINGDIRLLSSFATKLPLEVEKDTTVHLDLNGQKIGAQAATGFIVPASGILLVHNGGELVIDDKSDSKQGQISVTDSAVYSAVVMTEKGDDSSATAKLTVNGGTLIGKYYGISGNGDRPNTSVTINGGTIKGIAENDNAAIYNPQAGILEINGGTLEGATGIYVKSGTVETSIIGGTIKATGEKKDYQTTGDGFVSTGDAVVLDNCDYPGGAPNAKIKGGKFESTNGSEIASYAKTGKVAIKNFVYGGLFKDKVDDDLVAEGYVCILNTDSSTKTAYPYVVKPAEIKIEPAVVDDTGNITVGGETIEVEGTGEQGQPSAQEAANAITNTLNNPEVTTFTETKIEEATPVTEQTTIQNVDETDFDLSMILNEVKKEAIKQFNATVTNDGEITVGPRDVDNGEKFGDKDVKKQITVDLTAAAVTQTVAQATTTTVTSMTFEVKPVANITVTNGTGEAVTVTAIIPNEAIVSPITFRLPVDSSVTETWAAVYHESKFIGNYEIKEGTDGSKYIELSSMEFSEFSYVLVNSESAGAKIGDVPYQTFAEAVAAVQNNETIVLLKDNTESGAITVSREVTFTVDNNECTNHQAISTTNDYRLDYSEDNQNKYKIAKLYNVTAAVKTTEYGSATVTLNGKTVQKAAKGDELLFTAIPVDDCKFINWEVEGIVLSSYDDFIDDSLDIIMPANDLKLTAVFDKKQSGPSPTPEVDKKDLLKAAIGGAVVGAAVIGTGALIGSAINNANTPAEPVVPVEPVEPNYEPMTGYLECKQDGTCPMYAFSDLVLDYWYHDGIHFCLDNGLMNGVGRGKFNPDGTTSRAMMMTILARMDGQDTGSGKEWDAVGKAWAKNNGVSEGIAEDGNITREEFATMLYRYAKLNGQGFTGSWMFLLDFEDRASISAFADEAIHWCVMKGILTGKPGKLIDPQGTLTRAEASAMIQRFFDATK